MSKSLYIAEKPSVAQEFARALKQNMKNQNGYMESEDAIVTWCVGHLVTMSYPEVYDEKYKKWSLDTLPFLPKEWKYEVIGSVKEQYTVVSSLLNRKDVDCIYVCTDSGREGEYIYRLVEQMAQIYQRDEAQEMERVVWDLGQEWRYKYKKEWYEKSIEMPFENIMVPVPVGYEYILPRLYGNDYMTPKQDIAGHDYPFYKQQDIELEKMRKEKAENQARESRQ